MKAKTVFTHGIKYLKDHAIATIDRQGQSLDEMDIHWVITVPAIWSDAAKQFMREAAMDVSNLSRLVGKPTMWFPNRSDTNRPVLLAPYVCFHIFS